MKVTNPTVKKLLEKYREISLLGNISAVLDWDLNVNLPPKASQARSEQSAYLTSLITDKWLNPEFKSLLEQANSHLDLLNEEEVSTIRSLNRSARFYHKVPKEVIVELTKTSSESLIAWQKARKENKFKDFAPFLKRIIKLNQLIAQHLGYKDNPYDALLDMFEQGLTVKKVRSIFVPLQPKLTNLLMKIKRSKQYLPESNLVDEQLNYSVDHQKQVALFALKKINYDFEAGRIDTSAHPFTIELDANDVRITSRYKTNDFRESFTIAMHEGGHALYEQGISPEYSGTPLSGGVSFSIHESQSRFWENHIGRNPEFINWLTPTLQAFYPEQLGQVSGDKLIKLFNHVKPSCIRVEADEITYGLHIILRFEIEDELINGRLKVENLPKAWNAKMKKYLGIEPKTDNQGCLQDVHWAHGSFGYFPSYLLGNLYAAQFCNALEKEINVEELLSRGELGTILSWLRTNIHQHGSLYWPDELVKRVTGEKLNPKYFIKYLKEKYSRIYSL